MHLWQEVGIIIAAGLVIKFFGRSWGAWMNGHFDHPELRPQGDVPQIFFDIVAVLIVVGSLIWLFFF